MGVHILRDVSSSFSGDLSLDNRGDLDLASSADTHKGLVNFWLRTDQGDYIANDSVGADLGTFVGATMSSRLLDDVKDKVFSTLIRNVTYEDELQLEVVPFDSDELLIVLKVNGTYLDDDGNVQVNTSAPQSYTFPFIDASPTPITE